MTAAAVGSHEHPARRPGAGLLELGRQLLDQQQYREAALALQRRLRLAPADVEARRLLAECLLRTGEAARAADLLDRDRRSGALDAATCRAVAAGLAGTEPERARVWLRAAEPEPRATARHRRVARPWWRVGVPR